VPGPTDDTQPSRGAPVPAGRVVGRARELELLRAAVTAGRDVLLEGPPGTSKTTMLRAITEEWGVPLLFVEGNADLTTGKLVGHHAPDRVLREGYRAENFVDGPLVEAMRLGGFLYIEELNRSPQDTLNTLLSAMGDRRLTIPRIGTITAEPTFRLIASMNPFDNVGTMRISMSIYDRLCRLAVGYQDEDLEREIVEQRIAPGGPGRDDRLVRDAVALVRATRTHPDIRHGSSVRGAIDTVLVARELGRSRQVAVDLPGTLRHPPADYTDLVLDAMTVTLSGRIQLDPTAPLTPELVLHDIWETHFLNLAAAPGGENAVVADSPVRRPGPAPARGTLPTQAQDARGATPAVHTRLRREGGRQLCATSRRPPAGASAGSRREDGGRGERRGGSVATPAGVPGRPRGGAAGRRDRLSPRPGPPP
jgi:MoxR-like ATPase